METPNSNHDLSTYLLLKHSLLDMNSDSEYCVRPGAVSVHHSLSSFPLLASPLEDAVHLRLGVDLDFLETLTEKEMFHVIFIKHNKIYLDNHGPFLVSILVESQLGCVINCREKVKDLLVVKLQERDLDAVLELVGLLLEAIQDLGESPWDNAGCGVLVPAQPGVPLLPALHGEGLAGASLTVGENCAVISHHHLEE